MQFQCLAFIVAAVLILVDYIGGELGVLENDSLYEDSIDIEIKIIILAILEFLAVVIGAANLYLILFHAYLKVRNLTTYQFLISRKAMSAKVGVEEECHTPSEHALKRTVHKTSLSKFDSSM